MDAVITIILFIFFTLVLVIGLLYLGMGIIEVNQKISKKYNNFKVNIWFWFVISSLIFLPLWYLGKEWIWPIGLAWVSLFIMCLCLTLEIFSNIFKKLYNKFK